MSVAPVHIRTAGDLFEVLSTASLATRLAVLRDIIAQPTRPLKLGSHQGEDFVAFLMRLIPTSPGGGVLRQSLILCLMCYQDPRTHEFLGTLFAQEPDAATVLHLGQRLGLERGVDFFLPFLWGERPAQALAAAQVCAGRVAELEPKDRLRVALLLDGPASPPELSEETVSCWAAELRGPHRLRARQLAEAAGSAVLLLWTALEQPDDLGWLLELTERLEPARAAQEAERLLSRATPPVVRAARRLGVPLPPSLLESPDPEVRAAAIKAGWADERLADCLAASLPEALAAVPRCSSELLLSLLSDSRWQVRSAAVRALAKLEGERPLEYVRALAAEGSLSERVAAVALLEQWGDGAWLAVQLPTKS